jgi:hypothetical protein
MHTAAATLRAQSKKRLSKKKLNTREGPVQIRVSNSPWNRDLCGNEVYTHSNAKPTWFTLLFSYAWNLLAPKAKAVAQPARNKNEPLFVFFVVFAR